MSNRVSRYPFPDHHPPPLPLLPLAVREMTGWLAKDPENVAIIHCKAGKGRSGTLLCSYLLSLDELPPAPQSVLSYSHKERAGLGSKAKEVMSGNSKAGEGERKDGWILVGGGDEVDEVEVEERAQAQAQAQGTAPGSVPMQGGEDGEMHRSTSSASLTTVSDSVVSEQISYQPIAIGDEADYEQPEQYDRKDGKVDRVFKLHSSRRMKPTTSGRGVSIPSQRRWCRYVNLYFQRQHPSALSISDGESPLRIKLVGITLKIKAPSGWQKPLAKAVVGGESGQGKAWASIARYEDEYVDKLRELVRHGDGKDPTWGGVGGDGRYDSHKMFSSCGKLTSVSTSEEDGVVSHRLEVSDCLVLDRDREFRIKLHLSSLPLGWAWLIPAFHLPEPTPHGHARKHVLMFPKSQVDFTIGPGAAIKEMQVELEELPDEDKPDAAPLMSEQQERETGMAEREHVVEE